VYFVKRGEDLILLLAGGKKDTQARDISLAIALASEI
jgi:putative addiction module killer protein